MRVLFLNFPLEPALGGAETHTQTLAHGLKDAGHDVFLLSNNRKLTERFARAGLSCGYAWMGWEPTSVAALLRFKITWFTAFFKFRRHLKTYRPEIIFCTTLTDKLLATSYARKGGIKVFWIEHTRLGKWFFQNPLLFWYKHLAKKVRIIAPSFFLRNQLIAAGISVNSITVVYPGVEEMVDLKNRPSSPQTTLGYLGRLAEEKGVRTLIQASTRLKNPHRLMIAGSGPQETELRGIVKILGLDNVEFLGQVSDKQSFFSRIDILVVPSVQAESFGLAAVEAMAAGIPVVASRIGGVLEIIEDKKTGLMYEPGQIDGLVRKVEWLITNPQEARKMGEAARQAADSRFSSSRMLEDFLNLL